MKPEYYAFILEEDEEDDHFDIVQNAIDIVERYLFLSLYSLGTNIDVFLLDFHDPFLLRGDGNEVPENIERIKRWISFFSKQVKLQKIRVSSLHISITRQYIFYCIFRSMALLMYLYQHLHSCVK